MINASDVEYIAKNTGLSEERVIILTEQEKDFNLLINEISQKEIDDGLLTLSFPLYIFSFSKCSSRISKFSK